MRLSLLFLCLVAVCAALSCLASGAMLDRDSAAPGLSGSSMSASEQQQYARYLQDMQQAQEAYSFDFDLSQSVDVQCPVGTRGLSIPPLHVAFWKKLKLTRSLTWSGNNRFMCVPVRMRQSLNPIIAKLKTEKMIKVDPLTVPGLVDLETPSMSERESTITPEMRAEQEAMMMAEEEMAMGSDDGADFDAQGRHGWGGFGGFGFIPIPIAVAPVGLGLGYGGFGGYGGGDFGDVGLGYGGWGGLGFGGWGGGFGRFGRGFGFGGRGFGFGGRRGFGRRFGRF